MCMHQLMSIRCVPSTDITCLMHISHLSLFSLFCVNQTNLQSYQQGGTEFRFLTKISGHKSDLISMCQRCSSSLCLFSTAFCFCFFSLLSCSFLARLLGLISTGSSGFTFFCRDTEEGGTNLKYL